MDPPTEHDHTPAPPTWIPVITFDDRSEVYEDWISQAQIDAMQRRTVGVRIAAPGGASLSWSCVAATIGERRAELRGLGSGRPRSEVALVPPPPLPLDTATCFVLTPDCEDGGFPATWPWGQETTTLADLPDADGDGQPEWAAPRYVYPEVEVLFGRGGSTAALADCSVLVGGRVRNRNPAPWSHGPMITLTLLLIAAALAQEPRTIIYEFPEVEPVQGELLKPSASYLLPASVADARPCPARLSRLERQRRALERRRATADRTAALGDLDRCEARLTEVALWERWDAALAAGDAPPEEDADLAAIDALQRQAIARYDQALVSAELSQPDRVWMARGQAALGMRDEELAWASFQALLTQCPDSALAPMAHLQLGEQAFAEVQLDEAERHYRAITDGELTSFARYKLAWCRLNQGDEDGAKALFSELASGPDDDPLAVEARRDLTMLAATAEP